ncbi:hypothetical protein A3G63_00010 [Candidatus Kaiserbacteria bacterium RIFCSPLOWO2_12_FULL_52_8]|nr:MAG: hypothetical protein A3G63_00010 [Candidatus Kaiserbacteria bacterium RIFCSPLOWO2_12_FULL_52_8]
MRIHDTLRLSTRMFRTRILRTLLTILGVSVGIGTIVFLVSLGYGLQTLLLERITTSESLLSLDILAPESELVQLTQKTVSDISAMPGVEEVVPLANVPVQISVGEGITDVDGNITSGAYFRLSGQQEQEGTLYEGEGGDGIVISSVVAELFSWKPAEAVGKSVQLAFVVGPDRYSVDTTIIGTVEGIIPEIYVPVSLVPFVPETYSRVKARVQNSNVLESARAEIINLGYAVASLSEVVDQANKVFNALQVTLAIFGAAALLVSAIGMFNTMTIAFLERTQEIGILRAVGASRRDIFWLFVFESAIMGFLGGVGGIVIGFLIQAAINAGFHVLATSAGAVPVNLFRTPLWFIAVIIAFSTTVGLVTGVVPGIRAARLNPLHALKYK